MALVKKPPVLLKDYLFCRDDLSSCSSNGFRSFTRRQCCTNIRFPLEKQSSSLSNRVTRPPLNPSRSKCALHKASQVLHNAVKMLSFPSVKPQARKGGDGLLLLPRSLSKKLVKRGLWWRRKDRDQCNKKRQIGRWRSSREQRKVDEPVAADSPKTTSTAISSGRGSTTSSTDSKIISSRSSSWTESEFTPTDNLPSPSSSNSEVSEVKNDFRQQELQVSDEVGLPVGDGDGESKEASSSDEGKEQFSPVSVLDCPFDEDESDDSSPFQHHLMINGATNHKLIQKLRRIDGLQPLDLQKLLAPLSHSEEEDGDDDDDDEIFRETCSDTSEKLQSYFRSSLKLDGSDSDKLDFMSERSDHETDGRDLFSEAGDWIRGQPKTLILGWEVRQGRELYLKEMDKNGSWANLGLERKQIEAQLEKAVLSILVDELVADIFQP